MGLLKITNVIRWKIAPNVGVMEDAQNAMVVVMLIVMCAMVMDNAGIAMVMGEPDVPNVVATEDAGTVVAQEKSFAEIVMVMDKSWIVQDDILNAENVVEQVMHHVPNVLLQE